MFCVLGNRFEGKSSESRITRITQIYAEEVSLFQRSNMSIANTSNKTGTPAERYV